nr:c-type cytochrome [Acidovorax sp. SUPP3334]
MHILAACALVAWLACGPSAGQAAQEGHLGKEHGCMACHGMVRKQVGPGFAQIAERYRNDAEAPERLAGKIRNGSVGTWGRVIMPRQSRITETESRALAQWVLSQPPPP